MINIEIKKIIKETSDGINNFRNIDLDGTDLKIKKLKNFQLASLFHKTLLNYSEAEAEFKQRNTEQLKRIYIITYPNKSDNSIEILIEHQTIISDIYELKKNQDSTSDTLYEEAVETHKDINNLESNLIELQEIFIMLANLVEL